jgi:glycosyltransferase involved in cell wall biosynthesis
MLRKELNLTEATSIGVLVARLRPEKRVGDFIEAIAAARKKGADVRGVVVGDGPEEERLRAHAREAGEHVIFVGYQEDPARYVVAGDFLALTSEFEALPMSLIEAAACGRPAVASDVGGIREIVADGQSGIVVAAGDVAKFADAFAMLATDRELAASMGAAASRKWTSEYTFDAMADRYAKLLLNVSGPPVTWGVP